MTGLLILWPLQEGNDSETAGRRLAKHREPVGRTGLDAVGSAGETDSPIRAPSAVAPSLQSVSGARQAVPCPASIPATRGCRDGGARPAPRPPCRTLLSSRHTSRLPYRPVRPPRPDRV